jgi:hypothetical protein
MTRQSKVPIGFVAVCQCGVVVGALDYDRTDRSEASKIMGKWLADGCTVAPRFGTWSEKIGVCRCTDDPEPQACVDKAACISATICAHGYLQNPEDEGRVAHVIRQSLESPETHADDVETIRAAIESWAILCCCDSCEIMQKEALAALSRLSAPIDDLLLQEICSLREKIKIAISTIKSYDSNFDDRMFIHDLNSVDYAQLIEEDISAPIDVQAKAEAVVQDYCGTYSLTDIQKEKLSRLIVEQFSRKG